MAEFCKQCAQKWGMVNDFDAIVREGYVLGVVCEGCGPTYVIHDGSCVKPDCMERHGKPESYKHCVAGSDGECVGLECPQVRDGEPAKSNRSCPLPDYPDDDGIGWRSEESVNSDAMAKGK